MLGETQLNALERNVAGKGGIERYKRYKMRCVREMCVETQFGASEGKVADIGGISILKRERLQHLFTLNDLHPF